MGDVKGISNRVVYSGARFVVGFVANFVAGFVADCIRECCCE